jgi:hypothetical protein
VFSASALVLAQGIISFVINGPMDAFISRGEIMGKVGGKNEKRVLVQRGIFAGPGVEGKSIENKTRNAPRYKKQKLRLMTGAETKISVTVDIGAMNSKKAGRFSNGRRPSFLVFNILWRKLENHQAILHICNIYVLT